MSETVLRKERSWKEEFQELKTNEEGGYMYDLILISSL
jgi:hypothetical protein